MSEKNENGLPFIIVLGNEKGGTGKSTLAMHVIVSLLYDGYRVGSVDLDGRQGTLSRYIDNRKRYNEKNHHKTVPCSEHVRIEESHTHDSQKMLSIMNDVALKTCDVVVIDTPGSHTELSSQAHGLADTLITPINDSFIDLDLLAHVEDKEGTPNLSPSIYAQTVWEERKRKIMQSHSPMAWIVVRNRLGHLFTKNKEKVDSVLEPLSKRIGFKLASGFGERVIFRELFLSGLTLLDLGASEEALTFSHVSARQELRALMNLLPLDKLSLKKASRVNK
ncbi:division plane positioning ATPase MipZ [Candidatus Hepatobacter penaei]|uniref:division plane positioning ATPase MipZ n=1 Tax=Candidatus Hepatobacter penaei TaxID=1274402 RepID=UPI0004F32FAB|nr:division plane positioning ATPase MipZ [Candidatus Hepatobacter penaei]TGW14923.1 ATPase [bacterium NHP-B]